MFSFQQELRNFYKLLSELTWKVNKLEKDFTCSQCNSVDKCLGISNQGDEDKFLNEKGDYVTVSGFSCSDLLTCSTTTLPEGSNLYYTDARVLNYVSTLPVSTFSNDVPYLTAGTLPPDYISSVSNTAQIALNVALGVLSASFVSNNISQFTNNSGYVTQAQTDLLYYSLTNPNNYIALTALSAGTGISYNNLTGVITNSAPDQTVVLNAGTGISTSGTYPNFTITNTAPDTNFISSVTDTNTVDLDVTTNILTANVRHQDSTTINLSDDASGLKADLATGAAVANLGFTPEDAANKATDFTTINNTLYPSVEAVSELVSLTTGTTCKITTGNQTTTSNVVSDITGMVVALEANTRYRVYGLMRIGCNNTGGVRLAATFPALATCDLACFGYTTAITAFIYARISTNGVSVGAWNTVNAASGFVYILGEIETGANSGNIQFQFASGTNTQTSTIFETGTWLNFTEL